MEYQAYTPLALKTLASILTQSRSRTYKVGAPTLDAQSSDTQRGEASPLLKSVVIHRLGLVPVGQTSIIIAVSSPHRREAFEACEWILEEVKLKAQIWKREWYEGASVEGIVARDGGTEVEGEMKGVDGRDTAPLWKANFPPNT